MEAITLSFDPIDPRPVCEDVGVEDKIIDEMLDAYKTTVAQGDDLVRVGSLLMPRILKLLQDQPDAYNNTLRNDILVLLALFFLKDDQMGLRGQDINDLPSAEKAKVIDDLVECVMEEI